MKQPLCRVLVIQLSMLLAAAVSVQADEVTYADVAPIFALRCSKCHSASGLMGAAPEGYELSSYQAILSSAERVEVVPGFAEASELVRRIRGDALPRMPYDGPPYLNDADIALIVAWINQGARAGSWIR
ncbi:cytochrome c [Pseudomonas sp. 2FG]|uniref:c-type cytochrome n=1 Tax=Pseudomonas sp. 2FG TaxID=2502191 RepID=UPI002114EA42|nr:cytochrome c [Pseudomonas sp. 2FG]